MKQLHIALAYAEQGIPVFPCSNKTKRPIPKQGFKEATTDETKIRRWWGRFPDALIGSPNTEHTVVDIDIGKACEGSDILTENAMYAIADLAHDRDMMVVKTMSGGFHFYFRYTPGVPRRIFILPNIDILGEGGFVILPDQKTYIAEHPEPWMEISKLSEMPYDKILEMAKEQQLTTDMAHQIKKGRIGKDGEVAPVKKTKAKTKKSTKKLVDNTDSDTLSAMAHAIRNRKAVDYRTGELYIPQTPDMYKAVDLEDDELAECYDEVLVDGKLHVENGSLDSEKICYLFHNRQIQIQLAKFLGLKVPESVGDRTSQRSVFPSHIDARPSMGVRWHSNGSHLIIRDFSNHFGDHLQQVDYNVVRLYATIRYGCQAPRLKPPEFVVWFLRMLVEAGILDVSKNIRKYAMPSTAGADGFRRIGDDLRLLDAIKQLYKGYDGTTAFADRFATAWCNGVPSAVNRAKKWLVDSGLVAIVGEVDCSGGTRTDGFFNTNLYTIIDSEYVKRAKEAREQLRKESTDKIEETDMSNIVTMKGVRISQESYSKIVNFCEDFKIPNVPQRESMFVEVGIVKGTLEEPHLMRDATYYMEGLNIEITPSFDGGNLMYVVGDSKSLEDFFWDNKRAYDFSDLSDEPLIGFAISNDLEHDDYDLGLLSNRLSDYLQGAAAFDEKFNMPMRQEDVFVWLDGKSPAEVD